MMVEQDTVESCSCPQMGQVIGPGGPYFGVMLTAQTNQWGRSAALKSFALRALSTSLFLAHPFRAVPTA